MAEHVGTREIWEEAEAFEGGQKNPFDDPYGPTSNCFSDNDIARMFTLGVLPSDRRHLVECDACWKRIERFAAAIESLAPSFEPQRLTKLLLGWMGSILSGLSPARHGERLPKRQPMQPVGAHALVYVPAPSFVRPGGLVDTIRMQLFAPDRKVEDLRSMTLSLEGPAVSVGQVRVVDEGEGVPWVEFHNVQLSPRTLRELARHNRITEPLVIRGKGPAQPLIGRSNIELQKTKA